MSIEGSALPGSEGGRSVLDDSRTTIFTIGHSTRTFEAFLELLRENRIDRLVDVRHFPTSRRAPWATRAALSRDLPMQGVAYEHIESLGGYRKARADSANLGWRNTGFRGYADYMATAEFEAGVRLLLAGAETHRTAIMCAEAVPWKCHRSLLSDALLAHGVRVVHILGPRQTRDHRLTAFARIHGRQVTYPARPDKGV